MNYSGRWAAVGLVVFSAPCTLAGQVRAIPVSTGAAGTVRVFAESTEIRIAREAVSGSISRDADVYVYQQGRFVKAASGSNGFACMVARSDQAASLFPMCFDSVGARTLMQREMMRVELYAAGVPYEGIRGKIDSAFADGRLTRPDRPAFIYMMSPHQDLFNNTRELGRWEPHVMIYLPHTTAAQYQQLPSMMGIDPEDKEGVEIIVAMPDWSDQDSH
ncbi:MAG TPA: hypothetical protein VEV39_05210 [Gemmatimonadales bacterium]|nr:hypothetical protein [Gemmatimonadales bacterium]